ncbi:MAG: dockerin type I domain-containing protein, partial [Methanobrevibacter sp.]|nr:dockerin type I domain-containing protein [Methanobrevibacter sp.]
CGILTEVDVPATVSNVGREAFCGTSIKEFTLAPSKGTSIDQDAFRDCTALKRITINDPCCDILGDAIPETATIASYHFTDDPADFTTTENCAKSNNNDFESLGDMLFFSDVNDDGAVNLKDVVTIRRYIAYEGDEPREEAVPLNTQRADINQDGTINLKDVVLARRLAASITKN